ncbi:unnamed protein product [Ascophyllum nodosum]
MAHVYSYMLAHMAPNLKDLWGPRFYEAWALTLLILLQEHFPKSEAVLDDPSFRICLLDLCAEWTVGLRPSFPLTGHWVLSFDRRPPTELELFKKRTFGMGLSGSASAPVLSSGFKGDRRGEKTRRHKSASLGLNRVSSRSTIEVGNSPLVEEYLKVLTGGEKAAIAPLRLQVTREATRTLRPFHDLVLRHSNDKAMKSNAWRAAQAVRRSSERPTIEDILARIDQRRDNLLQQHATSKREARKHMAQTRADAAEDRTKQRNCYPRETCTSSAIFWPRTKIKGQETGAAVPPKKHQRLWRHPPRRPEELETGQAGERRSRSGRLFAGSYYHSLPSPKRLFFQRSSSVGVRGSDL